MPTTPLGRFGEDGRDAARLHAAVEISGHVAGDDRDAASHHDDKALGSFVGHHLSNAVDVAEDIAGDDHDVASRHAGTGPVASAGSEVPNASDCAGYDGGRLPRRCAAPRGC